MSLDKVVEYLQLKSELKVQRTEDRIEVTNGEHSFVVGTKDDPSVDWVVEPSQVQESPKIIASKLINRLGASQRIHARKCCIERIEKPVMEAFLLEHHINGSAGAKHKFGLIYEDELVALVSFATPRTIKGMRSAELVRFCVKSFYSIPGGLDKLLKHYSLTYPCDDIFTYVDAAWSSGDGFKRIGFQLEGIKEIGERKMMRLRKIIGKSSSHLHT